MTTDTLFPAGYTECTFCLGTGISPVTAEPIAALCGRKDADGAAVPDFQPQPLACSDCGRRRDGAPETRPEDSLSPSPYSVWRAKG